eukprot:9457314-Pyramimonas_sp.AAC.1
MAFGSSFASDISPSRAKKSTATAPPARTHWSQRCSRPGLTRCARRHRPCLPPKCCRPLLLDAMSC